MTGRPLRLLGDPVLRTPCDPVTTFDAALTALVTDLLDTVRVPGRAGLAANRIGVSLAAFSYNVDGRFGYVLNPRLVALDHHGPPFEVDAHHPRVGRPVASRSVDQGSAMITGLCGGRRNERM